jgi:hypothetical protein
METAKTLSKYPEEFSKICEKATNSESTDKVERLITHTQRVTEFILSIAKSLDLSEHESIMAETISIFHDIGRLVPYLTSDLELHHPFDHAEAGVTYLKSNFILGELDESSKNIVFESIRYHNKQEIPKKEPELISFYAKLLRDADKLDSWRTTVEYLTLKDMKPNTSMDLGLSDIPVISPAISKAILEGQIPSRTDLRTFVDFKLFQMSWVFDLNFKKSFQILNQKQYIQSIYDSLPKNNNVIDIYRMVKLYIENRI